MVERPARRALKVDCLSGISGDMLVGAFHDLLSNAGKDPGVLMQTIASIKDAVGSVKRLEARFSRVDKNGFAATYMSLDIEEDVDDAHGGIRAIDHNLSACMEAAGLSNPRARAFAEDVLHIIIDAEAHAHGIDGKRCDHGHDHAAGQLHVHLHELASADTLVDILCVARALEALGAFDGAGDMRVYSSPVSTGRGCVKTVHGILPVPAPGTLEILKIHGIPHVDGPVDDAELATPTGCAILAALRPSFDGMKDPSRTVASGTGAGTRTFPSVPNVLRLQLVEPSGGPVADAGRIIAEYVNRSPLQASAGVVAELTLSIDDMTPEDIGYLIEKSFRAGALDAYALPAQMKKQRPGVQVIVYCAPDSAPLLLAIWMEESTTLGCRVEIVERVTIGRHARSFHIELFKGNRAFSGDVVAKLVEWRQGTSGARMGSRPGFKVEHDDLKRVAEELGTSLHEARRMVERKVLDELERKD
ncbi:MAG: LarC family nickel insertion protein [Candidatus Lokiarchaeota archaeon]|nr:LarC family nickel insertion protein [Candidatus Lokiarchaeota archaeon]